MAYNLTNITDANGLAGIMIGTNELTNGLFGSFLLFVLFIVIFLSLKGQNDAIATLLVSSFATTLVGGLMVYLELLSWGSLSLVFVILIISIIASIWRN